MLGVHDIITLETMGVKNCQKAMSMKNDTIKCGYIQNNDSFDIIGIPILNLTKILTKDIE